MQVRKPGGRPPFRAEYGQGIRKILEQTPTMAMQDRQVFRTFNFLLKLADYLESDEYAVASTKAKQRKSEHLSKAEK